MFCKNCGSEIDEKAVVCPKCGVETGVKSQQVEQDAPNTGFAVLGFFFPLIGFIMWLIWKDKLPMKAKSCGKGALIGIIVSVVVGIISGIAMGSMLGSMMYYY